MFYIGVGMVVVGAAGFALFVALGMLDDTRLLVSSRPAMATVTAVRPGGGRRQVIVDYRYRDGNTGYEGTAAVNASQFGRVGAAIPVKVSTGSPAVSRPAAASLGMVVGWKFVLVVCIGVMFAGSAVGHGRRLRRAYEHGAAVVAVVAPTPPGRKSSAHAVHIHYVVAGQTYETRIGLGHARQAPPIGSALTLLVHPSAPYDVVLWS